MNRSKFVSFGITTALLVTVLALPQIARAGTPLICFPFDIGSAPSLPWGNNRSSSELPDYDLSRLVGDTEALLTPDVPVIVRMETLRRATLYAQKNPKVAQELLTRLQARAQAAEAKGRPDALPWFDLGYLAETYKQSNLTCKKQPGGSYNPEFLPTAASAIDGYAMVMKAINLRGQDAEMEFAASLITAWPRQESYHSHLRMAVAGASDSSLLARNLVTHFGNEGRTIAELRVQVGNDAK